ncbi:Ja08 [Japanese cytomegalovirus]|nr:Ja08 [Japanese cytomegalovirus]
MNEYNTLVSCFYFLLYAYIAAFTHTVTLRYVYNVSIGENITLSKPDNLSFQLHHWFCERTSNTCSKQMIQLCQQTASDNEAQSHKAPKNCFPPTFTCNTTGLYLYNFQDTDPTNYILIQRSGSDNVKDRNTTYIINLLSITHTPPPLLTTHSNYFQPVAQTHANTSYNNITITLTVITLALFISGAGYLKHRKSSKHHKHTHKCMSLDESTYPESSI